MEKQSGTQHANVDKPVKAEEAPERDQTAAKKASDQVAHGDAVHVSQSYSDQSLMQAIQAHVKLTTARMYSGAARIFELVKSKGYEGAGISPILQQIEEQIALVNNDLDNLETEISKNPKIVNAALSVELGALRGVIHHHQGWAAALNAVYSYTHDANGAVRPEAQGMVLTVGATLEKVKHVFRVAGVDENDVNTTYSTVRDPSQLGEQRDEQLKAAELEALQASMHSVEAALALINADLHSSMQDLGKEASDLTMSVEQLVEVFEPINASHIGKMSKLPNLIKRVEALQADVMGMADTDKGKALAPRIGYNTKLSSNLHRLKTKMGSVAAEHKPHHR